MEGSCSSTIKPYMCFMPLEILEQIFHNLDGKTLMCCRRVCKTWGDHINYLEKKKGFWYDKCQKEIPTPGRFDVLGNVFPDHWRKTYIEDIEWKIIYKCWYVWSVLHKKIATSQMFVTGLKGISSMKVSGEWLVISTCEGGGTLSVQNIKKPCFINMFVTTSTIFDFELVNCDKTTTSMNMAANRGLENIFNTLKHNEIWLELKDSYIQLGKNYWRTWDKTRQHIRHSKGYQIRLIHNGSHSPSVVSLKKICKDVSGPTTAVINLPMFYGHLLDFWENRITLSCYEDHTRCIKVSTLTVNMNSQGVETIDKCYLPCTDKKYSRLYAWRGSLFALTNMRPGSVVFRTVGKMEKQDTSVTRTDITAVLFYCNYLFLGSDRGKLLIYQVDSSGDSLPAVVNESEPRTVTVDSTKIVHIAVIESANCNENKPMIACASSKNVYLISFTDCCLKHG